MESAGGKLGPSQAGRLADDNRRQIIALARVQQRVVGERAGADDPRHLAPHEPLGLLRVFRLIADGDAQAGGDELAEIAFKLMVGEAGHGDRIFPFVAAGERQIEHSGGGFGVVEKHLVEIAHAKQQNRIPAGRLGVLILLHHRRGRHTGAW